MAKKANIKLAAKLYPKREKKIDTVLASDNSFGKRNDVLMDAFRAWTGLEDFRKKARRNMQYTFGDQWGDYVRTNCGVMTERENILKQGNVPLQNNRIRGIVRTVTGVFQSAQTEPVCISRDRDKQSKGEMMSSTIQYVYQLNKMWGLDSFNFQSFLITGLAAFKSNYSWRNDKMDVWTDAISHYRLFFDNHMEDYRHWDCHLIGEIHDLGLYDVMAKFSDGSREKADRIREIYRSCSKERTISYLENITHDHKKHLSFFVPSDETRCRVIEIWKKESKERLLVHDSLTGEFYKAETEEEKSLIQENSRRVSEWSEMGVEPKNMRLISYKWTIDNYWYFYYISPQGDVLKEGETPFWHKSHPYSFKIYPFFNGQVFPFVSDFIDQQRYINRIITLQDFVIRSSAKGVLAIPEEALGEMSKEEIADEWATFNGVFLYKSKGNIPPPHQIVSNSTQLGLTDMLQIQLKLLEDISGVQGALQGQAPRSGTPAALYLQQTQNATTGLTELLESYRELREERDMKNMKLIQQFYTEPRYINVNGSGVRSETTLYDPQIVRNAEFDLSITESQSTPAYRMMANDFLMQLFQTGQIALEELLENGAFPFADKLLQSVKARQEDLAKAQQDISQGMPSQSLVPGDIQQQMPNPNPIVQQMFNPQQQAI